MAIHDLVSLIDSLFDIRIPVRKRVSAGTVPVNKKHLTGTVPANKEHLTLKCP